MTIGEKRRIFTRLLARLINQATMLGYEAQLDEVKRSQAAANANALAGTGIANSLHTIGLAADMDLFLEGKLLTDTESYRTLGEWWEAQHPLCCWGGRFTRQDGRHFSLTHNGVK